MYYSLIIIVILVQLCVIYGNVNKLPNIPCPDMFQYTNVGQRWGAEFTLPPPDVNEVVLIVNFTVPENYVNDIGELSLTNKNIIDDIRNKRPFVYSYRLGNSKHLPHLTEINYNGRIICTGPDINSQPNFKFSLSKTFNWFSADIKLPPRPKIQTISGSGAKPKHVNDNNCGVTRERRQIKDINKGIVPFIYNGEVILRNDHPWLVALYESDNGPLKFFCGGNLISNRHILTAAHCLQNRQKVDVKVGAHDTGSIFENGAILRNVRKINNHEDYRKGSGNADISVLVLSEDIEFTEFIKPICLWMEDDDINTIIGERGTIMGWGLTESRDSSNIPLKTDVEIVAQQVCESNAVLKKTISNSTFCAGSKGSGPCIGDSGGGLILRRHGKWFLRGIISIALGNRVLATCDVNTYAVYVDTTRYINWIIDNMD